MITQYKIVEKNHEICIAVKRSDRRTIGLEVKRTGEVLVRTPTNMSDKTLSAFIEKHRAWIINKVILTMEKRKNAIEFPPADELTYEELEMIQAKIWNRVSYYRKQMEVTVGRITIRNQKTRWGSCSSKGNLNFNYRLYYLPEELLDYVVVHELAHRSHMNHSKEFWEEVEKYMPDYKERKKRLGEIRL